MQNANIEKRFFNICNSYNDQIINPLLAVLLEHVVFSYVFLFVNNSYISLVVT